MGAFLGYVYATLDTPNSPQEEVHVEDISKNTSHNSGSTHEMMVVSDETTAPTILLRVTRDAIAGYNVNIETTNFTFTPESASEEHVPSQGHAHLYVNGEKIARVYGSWFHIPVLEPGENTIRATLNTNDHKEYAVDGKPIEATATVIVSEEEHNQTPHEH